jgi:hypothetical protein
LVALAQQADLAGPRGDRDVVDRKPRALLGAGTGVHQHRDDRCVAAAAPVGGPLEGALLGRGARSGPLARSPECVGHRGLDGISLRASHGRMELLIRCPHGHDPHAVYVADAMALQERCRTATRNRRGAWGMCSILGPW